MNRVVAYIGKGNSARIQLLEKGRPVQPGVVERCKLVFGDWCLDTDNEDHPAQLVEAGRAMDVQIGLVPGIKKGSYQGFLTVYDAETSDVGLAWGELVVLVDTWQSCKVAQ